MIEVGSPEYHQSKRKNNVCAPGPGQHEYDCLPHGRLEMLLSFTPTNITKSNWVSTQHIKFCITISRIITATSSVPSSNVPHRWIVATALSINTLVIWQSFILLQVLFWLLGMVHHRGELLLLFISFVHICSKPHLMGGVAWPLLWRHHHGVVVVSWRCSMTADVVTTKVISCAIGSSSSLHVGFHVHPLLVQSLLDCLVLRQRQ